ncbi:hypothetical protein V495_08385 [Pseudogymnoascus sp. VKM F-4514 (FW-929)]|nr:hypothetical protein V495_08385 [Pseudogymnoascus sp. VKM F-4514 (FW-929)]KFY52307.1 hypothetical protein V497_08558 [Pseudogymnoascus sp. VKM F-4516 (FW-969)]
MRNWRRIWTLRELKGLREPLGTPAQSTGDESTRGERWRQTGFMKDALQFWLLGQIMLDSKRSRDLDKGSKTGDNNPCSQFDQPFGDFLVKGCEHDPGGTGAALATSGSHTLSQMPTVYCGQQAGKPLTSVVVSIEAVQVDRQGVRDTGDVIESADFHTPPRSAPLIMLGISIGPVVRVFAVAIESLGPEPSSGVGLKVGAKGAGSSWRWSSSSG